MVSASSTGPLPHSNLQPAYGSNWANSGDYPWAHFYDWAQQYISADDWFERELLSLQGSELARARREAMAELIQFDPEAAISLAIPIKIREQLPDEVQQLLERRITGLGAFEVLFTNCFRDLSVQPLRTVLLDGERFLASVYGRRLSLACKDSTSLHGIAIGQHFAVHESAYRLLEEGESPMDYSSGSGVPALTSLVNAKPDGLFAEGDGGVHHFDSHEALAVAELDYRQREAAIGPHSTVLPAGADGISANRQSAAHGESWTLGNKKVLVVRVISADETEAALPLSTAAIQDVMDKQVAPFFQRSSYGQTTLTTTVASEFLHAPKTHADYNVSEEALFGTTLISDIFALLNDSAIDEGFDRVLVIHSGLSKAYYSGLGQLGGKIIYINGVESFNLGVLAHELGHTYGLGHANLWKVTDGNPLSHTAASAVEYGNPFDPMGSGEPPNHDFNLDSKLQLAWVSLDGAVPAVEASGTFRIQATDSPLNSGTLGLRVKRNPLPGVTARAEVLVSYSHGATNQSSAPVGAAIYIPFGILVDALTPGSNPDDAYLTPGSRLIYEAGGYTIESLAEGGSHPNYWIDVRVTYGHSAPSFWTDPDDLVILPSKGGEFQAGAHGIPSPDYKWQVQLAGAMDWQDLAENATFSQTTSSTLKLTGLTTALDGAKFRCIASNTSGIAVSKSALLQIPGGASVVTIAGRLYSSRPPYVREEADGPGRNARFSSLNGAATSTAGNIYLADSFNSRVPVIDQDNYVTTAFRGFMGNSFTLAIGPNDDIYTASPFLGVIQKVSVSGGNHSLVAGTLNAPGYVDGPAGEAKIFPEYLVVASDGTIYFTQDGRSIRKVALDGTVSTLAGHPSAGGYVDAQGSDARFSGARNLALGSDGSIYVVDTAISGVRKITSQGIVTTVANGSAGTGGLPVGSAWAIAVNSEGRLFFSDAGLGLIYEILSPGNLKHIAGVTGANRPMLDGPGSAASFIWVDNMAAGPNGSLILLDSNKSVRMLRLNAPAVPSLSVHLQDGIINLSWPGALAGYYLERNRPERGNHGQVQFWDRWTPVTNNPSVQEGRFTYQLPASQNSEFFRLQRQQ